MPASNFQRATGPPVESVTLYSGEMGKSGSYRLAFFAKGLLLKRQAPRLPLIREGSRFFGRLRLDS